MVVSLSELALDGRVRRQLEFLRSDFDVVVAAVSQPLNMDGVEFVALDAAARGPVRRRFQRLARALLRQFGQYERAYWLDQRAQRWLRTLRRLGTPDAIVVNDLWALPAAFAVDPSIPVIFDSHEHWTSESASWTRWQRLSMRKAHDWLVDNMVPRTAAMMTVSPGIARDYRRRIGARPTLVTNAPSYQALSPTPVHTPIRLVHVGLADERRRLEDTIEVVQSLSNRFSLDLYLARDNDYRLRLERLVAHEEHIRILPPVPQEDLIPICNQYDIGVSLWPATFPNQVYVLPNKLFQYIQARLAVAIGPSPEMATIVQQWHCGIVSDSFSPASLADALDALSANEIERLKRNADQAAHVLTAEANRETVLGLVSQATTTRKRVTSTLGRLIEAS